MPIFNYQCLHCEESSRKLLTPEQASAVQLCKKCGAALERNVSPPTARVTETLDNGIMPRRLERLADAEQIYRDHAKTGPK